MLNFWKILTFGGSRTDPLLPMRVKFGVLEQTQGVHLQTKFHLNVFVILGIRVMVFCRVYAF